MVSGRDPVGSERLEHRRPGGRAGIADPVGLLWMADGPGGVWSGHSLRGRRLGRSLDRGHPPASAAGTRIRQGPPLPFRKAVMALRFAPMGIRASYRGDSKPSSHWQRRRRRRRSPDCSEPRHAECRHDVVTNRCGLRIRAAITSAGPARCVRSGGRSRGSLASARVDSAALAR